MRLPLRRVRVKPRNKHPISAIVSYIGNLIHRTKEIKLTNWDLLDTTTIKEIVVEEEENSGNGEEKRTKKKVEVEQNKADVSWGWTLTNQDMNASMRDLPIIFIIIIIFFLLLLLSVCWELSKDRGDGRPILGEDRLWEFTYNHRSLDGIILPTDFNF